MRINDKLIISNLALANIAANGLLSSATIISEGASITVNQTTANIFTTLPIGAPLVADSVILVRNSGTQTIWVNNLPLIPNGLLVFVYNGTDWNRLQQGNTIATITATGVFPKVDYVFFGNGGTNMTGTIRTSQMNIGDTINVCRSVGATGTLTLQGQSGQITRINNTIGATTTLANANAYGQHASFLWNGTNLLRINNG